MGRLGEDILRRIIDRRVKMLSGSILNILELLVSTDDSRFNAARKQMLDAIGLFNRELQESIKKDFKITPRNQETIMAGDR